MNENHLRAIRSSLLSIEKRLTELREIVTNKGETYRLCRWVDDLGDEHRSRTLRMISEILSEVDYAAETFRIEPTEMSLRKEVESVFSGVWVVAEGLNPKNMKGYGTFDERDRETLLEVYERLQKVIR